MRAATAASTRVLERACIPAEAGRERMGLLFEGVGLDPDPERDAEASDRYDRAYRSNHRLIPGAMDLLLRLKDRVKLGVVTNGPVDTQAEKIRASGLEPLLDVAVISEGLGIAKPDPTIFETALRKLEIRPDEAVFVGDSWTADIQGALHCGIRAVWFNRYRQASPDPGMVTEIHSYEPVEDMLAILAVPAERVS